MNKLLSLSLASTVW